MGGRSRLAATALCVLLSGAVVTAAPAGSTPATGAPQATKAQRTYPRVLPRTGSRRTAFAVYFTLRAQPGHTGVLETDYRVDIGPPPHARPACAAPAPDTITTGQAGDVRRVALAGPAGGWCAGRYAVTIFLQRGPYCPPPQDGQPPTPCPEFATQELDTGRAHFVVRPRR